MVQTNLNRTFPREIIVFLICVLITMAACSTSTVSNPVPTQPASVQGTSIASTPGIGPTIILTPTKGPGGSVNSQLVTLPDRILSITHVSKQAGTDSSSLGIDLTITIKNIGAKTIKNDATYFQLTSAEGDAFGLRSGVNSNFFGVITSQSSRSGMIIFQVPSGALNGIRLLYRPESAKETIFVPLNFT
jgi:Domain of unknown function (DUF4352)